MMFFRQLAIVAVFFGLSAHVQAQENERPRFRYELEFGPVYAQTLDAQSPPGVGTELELGETTEEVSVTANVLFEINKLGGRHAVVFFIAPLELRDFEPLDETVSYDGVLFPPGKDTVARYLYDEYAVRYRYDLIQGESIHLGVGGSLLISEIRGTIVQEDRDAEITEREALPLAYLDAIFHFSPKIKGVVEAEGMRYSNTRRVTVAADLRVQWNRRWDFGVGYRWLDKKLETDAIRTKFVYGQLTWTVGFSF